MLTFNPADLSTAALQKIRKAIDTELSARNITGIGYRINPEMRASLEPAVKPGGLLHHGTEVKSNDLRHSNRAWRRLIEDLKTNPDGERRKHAEAMLRELGVAYRDTGKDNARLFYLNT